MKLKIKAVVRKSDWLDDRYQLAEEKLDIIRSWDKVDGYDYFDADGKPLNEDVGKLGSIEILVWGYKDGLEVDETIVFPIGTEGSSDERGYILDIDLPPSMAFMEYEIQQKITRLEERNR